MTDANGYVLIPKWFVSFLSVLVTVVCVGATAWAWTISQDMAAIKTRVAAATELRENALNDIRRRLDRLERHILDGEK